VIPRLARRAGKFELSVNDLGHATRLLHKLATFASLQSHGCTCGAADQEGL
jgi:hypothetical protein